MTALSNSHKSELTLARKTAASLLAFFGSCGLAPADDAGSGRPDPFPVARVHFETNATDGDVEVVFKVKGGDEGLAKLSVVAPNGRTVIDFSAPDPATLGIRQFDFESPEPPDVERLKAAYPEGVYTFSGATAAGQRFHGESKLDHTLPATASFVQPGPDAEGVAVQALQISWTPVTDAAAYIIEIEQDDLDVNVTAKVPGTMNSFSVPEGILAPGTEYELAIGTVSAAGNISFVETGFTTAAAE